MPLTATKSAYTEGESITISASATGPAGTSSTIALFVSGISPSDTSASLAGSPGNYSISKPISFGTTGIGSATFTIPILDDGVVEGTENWSLQFRDGSVLNLSVADQSALPDTIPPTVQTFSPAAASNGISLGSNITLTFGEAVQKGVGDIELRAGSATGSLVESFNVATSSKVTVSGATLTLDPTSDLIHSTRYFIVLPSGVVKDFSNNNYGGTSSYEFTTISTDTSPPTILNFSPSIAAIDVSTNADLVIKFSEAIQRGAGLVSLREGSATGRIIEQYDSALSSQLSFYGPWLKINPSSDLSSNTKYFVTISDRAIKDSSDNYFPRTSDYEFATRPRSAIQLGTNSLPTFNNGSGAVALPSVSIASWSEEPVFRIFDVAIQSDSSIFIAGWVQSGTGADLALARYDRDGKIDPTFSGDGKLTQTVFPYIKPNPNSAVAYSVIAQDDGKVVLGGAARASDGITWAATLVRYNVDGSLDSTFSNDGLVTSVISGGSEFSRIAIQPDGRILAAGFCKVGSGENIYVARFNQDGTFDTAFGKNKSGIITTAVGSGSDRAYDIALQADGKIVVVGNAVILRYTATGDLDTSFSSDGIASASAVGSARRIAMQEDGKILVAGSSGVSSIQNFLLRCNADGTLDTSFDGDGVLYFPTENGTRFPDLDLQLDGKIVVCTGSAVFRLNQNGTLDLGFGSDGSIQVSASQCEIQSDGRLVISDKSLVRYLQNGTLDTTFGGASSLATKELSYVEGGPSFVLAESVVISDLNLNQLETYQGSSISLIRHGGANSSDVFSIKDITSPIIDGTPISIGTVVKNSNGELKIVFDQNSNQAAVNQLLQRIEYKNTSNSPDLSVLIDWTFSDGNEGTQGTGGEGTIVDTIKIDIIPSNDSPSGSVNILGVAREGQTLFADGALVDADGLGSIQYSWRSGDTFLSTGSYYNLKESDVGRQITVTASYADGFGTSESVTSSPIGSVIADVNHQPVGDVILSGTPKQGETLSVGNTISDLDGLGTIIYTWKSGSAIVGNGLNYVLTQSDVGKQITVAASYTDVFGAAENVTSAATAMVENVNDAPVLSQSTPRLLRTMVGQTNPIGQTIASFLGTSLSDPDGVEAEGIAVFEVNGASGKWQYLLAGGSTWVDLGDVSESSALLLDSSDYVRWHPTGDSATTAELIYFGWDQTTGDAGSRANVTERGGATAFSVVSDTATLQVVEAIYADTSFTLADGDTKLVLTGTAAINGTGNALDNDISGNSGVNTLSGLGGNDTLKGGAGNDVLDGGSGIDTADFSDKTLSVTVNLRSPAMTMVRVGNVNEDRLRNIENLIGGSGNDSLTGNAQVNVLLGGSGNDTLDGGAGADRLVGGAGEDIFVIDHSGDVVTELAGEGIDLIRTILTQIDLIDYDHIENLTYTGRSNSTLIGSDIDNVIRGGSRTDIIEGGAGSDTLYGGDGADLLFGYYDHDDADINGGDNAFSDAAFEHERANSVDWLYGGRGNDIYLFDQLVNTPVVIEYRGEGTDTILGDVAHYAMTDNVENYINDGCICVDGVLQYIEIRGNGLNNIIRSSPNWDLIPDTAGLDWVATNIKKLLDSTSDFESSERFFGMAGNDTLLGGAGDDYLSGGEGRDRLTGGTGADQFVFDAALNRSANVDTVTDFVSGQDKIVLDSNVFSRFSLGEDVSEHFSATGRAVDVDDYLIYSASNKTLYYDADGSGSGAAVVFAVLTGVSSLSSNDFLTM